MYGLFPSCCPSTSLVVLSKASMDMWNDIGQFGPYKIGASKRYLFKPSKEYWQSLVQLKFVSLENKENKGDSNFG